MKVCATCSANREPAWRVCPFCQTEVAGSDSPPPGLSPELREVPPAFNPLAAVDDQPMAENAISEPALVPETAPENPGLAPLTEEDLAHLTSPGAVSAHGLAGLRSEPDPETSSDAPIAPKILIPLVLLAIVVVGFVGYAIVTQEPRDPDDLVAYIDGGDAPTTSLAQSTATTTTPTTTTWPALSVSGRAQLPELGNDVAEQLIAICAGRQMSIVGATEPVLGLYNDLAIVERDGREPWTANPAQPLSFSPIPPLVRCHQTADAGLIERCDDYSNGFTYSRRSVDWLTRVIRTVDGVEIGKDGGTATDAPPCPAELTSFDDRRDFAGWAQPSAGTINAVGGAYVATMNPSDACWALHRDVVEWDPGTSPGVQAVHWAATNRLVPLPDTWTPSTERPLGVALCLEQEAIPADDGSCETEITVVAANPAGDPVGTWTYLDPGCDWGADLTDLPEPPASWFAEVVGPDLGHPFESAGA